MEASSIYAISSVASAVMDSPMGGMLGDWFYAKYKKWHLRKRLSGMLLLKGISTLCEKLSDNQTLFFDIDVIYRKLTMAKDATDVNKPPTVVEAFTAYPILKNHIFNLCNIYKNNIAVVSHSLELLRAVGVYNANITFYACSKDMETRIGAIFPNETERAYAEITKFRTLRELNSTQVVIVESLVDLERKIKEKYNISKSSL